MEKFARLIITDSYFNIFPVLTNLLKGKTNSLDGKNIVFCEEKFSLMAERCICDKLNGSFNTDVYSFGNFLRKKKALKQVLSKEGSAMAVKKVISETTLKCFSESKSNLAGTLFDLIIQLKSAGVTPNDVEYSAENTDGVLKNKLIDIATIFRGYEDFIKEKNFDDQNSILSYLPLVIAEDKEIKDTDVFLLGYSSFTAQARDIILALLNNAKSVTAILVGGDNQFLYLNETIDAFRALCSKNKVLLKEEKVSSLYSKEGEIIKDGIFDPKSFNLSPYQTNNVYVCQAENAFNEIEIIAKTIKSKVMEENARYSDFTIAVPDAELYKERIRTLFSCFDIPYFLDEKKKPENHPLIKLILLYIDVVRKNFERDTLIAFLKNPLVIDEKEFADEFSNYLVKYNVNYSRIKKPFTLGFTSKEEQDKYNAFRESLLSLFDSFNIRAMLNKLNVEEKISRFVVELKNVNEFEEADVSAQIYDSINSILTDMENLLDGVKMSYAERKNVFLSGVSALELSIIPKYLDAVFIGGYKEASLAQAKHLFLVGLTSDVPGVKDDVALLTDADINRLEEIKVLIEPKIKIVNRRVKESVGLSLSAFKDKLYLFIPSLDDSGKKKIKSEVVDYAKSLFTLTPYQYEKDYLTFNQGLKNFAKSCSDFVERKIDDFNEATSFYKAVEDKELLSALLSRANKEVVIKLKTGGKQIAKSIASPTAIEEYYKCPYRAFASRALKLKEAETGEVDALSVGNIMHEIFNGYLSRIDEIDCEETSKKIFIEEYEKVLSQDVYARHLTDPESTSTVKRLLNEAEGYCYKTYKHFTNSAFRPKALERSVKLPITKDVTVYGKIDRVDAFNDYVRIIDYKTGTVDGTDKSLFVGLKLQLYLYAAAILREEKDKKLAGIYYSHVSDKYVSEDKKEKYLMTGKSLYKEDVLSAQEILNNQDVSFVSNTYKNTVSEERLNEYMAYALKLSENAVKQIADGVIVSSPYDNACEYCGYKGLCEREFFEERKVAGVDGNVIAESLKEGGDGYE